MSYNIGAAENGPDSLLLSREDYDVLVDYFPRYMNTTYERLVKNWSIAGVRVFGTESQIDGVRENLRLARTYKSAK